jgi:branched-chain amino acid aminotransferase
LCGTGQEILPVTSIDKLPVGSGEIGHVTRQMSEDYFGIVRGTLADHPEWRTMIE